MNLGFCLRSLCVVTNGLSSGLLPLEGDVLINVRRRGPYVLFLASLPLTYYDWRDRLPGSHQPTKIRDARCIRPVGLPNLGTNTVKTASITVPVLVVCLSTLL